ncbi:NHL repeat-containing protein 2 [Lasioglossum baleicum]|uniref:NHL repeat-containing protein 2 n=1 Tax=Lasioglossum baleicum TaxID=434251 RepID=UPI003FCC6EA3
MNVRDIVEELTQTCIENRRNVELCADKQEREELVLKHIKTYTGKGFRITDFQTGLEWFNVAEGLSVYGHLADKLIVLDFFTYCCINCMHVLPDLNLLEKQFSITDGLVVIGVHSAKFSNERDSKRLLAAIQRYNITHPVVNDTSLSVWQNLGICCWPTLVMIGPRGEPLAVFVGEGHKEELLLYTSIALTYFKSLRQISNSNLPLQLAKHLLPSRGNKTLLFPSKVETFRKEQGECLVISDTGNNRILVADVTGNVEHVIGGPDAGFRDGNLEDARFNAPQGVCIFGSTIYVADNENHAIRKIDLTEKIVSTIAGTGLQGHDYVGGKTGRDQALSSPWDISLYRHEYAEKSVPVLLIAMAGTHQIWALFLEDCVWWKNREYKANTCVAVVGSGREENRNNTYPHAAGLAQPSGLVIVQDRKLAFFADSESSAIRSVDLKDGRVSGVCGANRNPADLHDYGDSDGVRNAVKLQHPLGITWHSKDNVIYIADTYNHKIKRIDVSTGCCNTIYGDGKPNELFSFDEPSGLAVSANGDLLYVADTNNHAIKVVDARNNSIAVLPIDVLVTGKGDPESVCFFDTTISEMGGELNITFDVIFSDDRLYLNTEAPQRWSVNLSASDWIAQVRTGNLTTPVSIKVSEGSGTHEVYVTLDVIACKTTECVPKKLSIVYRVHQRTQAADNVTEHRQVVIK